MAMTVMVDVDNSSLQAHGPSWFVWYESWRRLAFFNRTNSCSDFCHDYRACTAYILNKLLYGIQ